MGASENEGPFNYQKDPQMRRWPWAMRNPTLTLAAQGLALPAPWEFGGLVRERRRDEKRSRDAARCRCALRQRRGKPRLYDARNPFGGQSCRARTCFGSGLGEGSLPGTELVILLASVLSACPALAQGCRKFRLLFFHHLEAIALNNMQQLSNLNGPHNSKFTQVASIWQVGRNLNEAAEG